MHACSRVFPLQVTQPRTPSGTIVHLWQLRAAARYTAVQRDPSRRILHAWRALATYRQAAVRAHKDCKDQKRRHILDLLAKAEGCAHRCDQRGLYQVVRQLAPWKPHTKILLKGEGGVWNIVANSSHRANPRRTALEFSFRLSSRSRRWRRNCDSPKWEERCRQASPPPRPGNWLLQLWLRSCNGPSKLELSRTRPSRASGPMPGSCGYPSRAKHPHIRPL